MSDIEEKEIVAAMIDGHLITSNLIDIQKAIVASIGVQLLSRQHMQMMADCDLGHRWEALAKAPTILTL